MKCLLSLNNDSWFFMRKDTRDVEENYDFNRQSE